MKITDYKKELGIISKKEARAKAPNGAQWSDLLGLQFWKIDNGIVFTYCRGNIWIPSAMSPDMLVETYFYKLKR